MSPLPVRVARALGAERVIAVDVVFDPNESRLSSTIDRLFQTALVMTRTLANQEAREADVHVAPTLPPEAEVTLENHRALIAAGERAALAALPSIKALIASDRMGPVNVSSGKGGKANGTGEHGVTRREDRLLIRGPPTRSDPHLRTR